jgi:transposase
MGTPASLDLRRRVVDAYREGGATYAEVAERFAVGQASVSRWLNRFRASGGVEPRPHGGGQPRKIKAKDDRALEALVLAHPDWTEARFTEVVRKELGLDVSEVTVGRAIRRLGYSVKKKRSSRPNAIAPTLSAGDKSGAVKSETPPLRVWFLWTKRVRTSR